MKAVNNSVLALNITNDHCEAWELFLDNRYYCTDIFSIPGEEMEIIVDGVYKNNRIGLPGEYK